MSFAAYKWAWDQCITASEKIVLLSLADRSDDKNKCYPSINRLSKDTCLNRKTVIICLNKLVGKKLISVRKSQGESNIYTLLTSTNIGTSTKINTSPEKGTRVVPKQVLEPVPILGHKPINNLSINLPIYIDEELFNDFWSMRKKLKAVNSDKALQLLITKFEQFKANGEDPNKAIERSIENSWKSIFPDRSKNETYQQSNKPKSNTQQFWDRTKARVIATA